MVAHIRVTQTSCLPARHTRKYRQASCLFLLLDVTQEERRGTVVLLPSYRIGHQHRKEFCKIPSNCSKVISGETDNYMYTDGHDEIISLSFPWK